MLQFHKLAPTWGNPRGIPTKVQLSTDDVYAGSSDFVPALKINSDNVQHSYNIILATVAKCL